MLFAPQGEAVAVSPLLPTGRVAGLSVGVDRLVLAGIGISLTIALVVLQRRTRFGLATSAVAESRTIAASMGWSPDAVATATWAIGSVVAAGAVILAASISGLAVTNLSLLVVPALAAALVGRFESFPLTLLGAMIIGIGQSEVARYVSAPGWTEAAPLLVIVVVLVAQGRFLPSRAETLARTVTVGPGRIGWGAALAVVGGIVVILAVSLSWLQAFTVTLLFALVVLSVVVVTGYAGQLSLAQVALAGVGAFLAALFAAVAGLPLWAAMLLGSITTVPVGLAVAVPALRTRGSNLAIATLSLAVVIDVLVLSNPDLASSVVGPQIGPLHVLGISFDPVDHLRNYALLSFLALILAGFGVANLRRGASGRRLLAVRTNERAAAALGISVPGVKLFAFALGALLAGTAGALLEAQFVVADFSLFTVLGSINSVLWGTLGGLGWIAGAPVGATAAEGGIGAKVISLFVAPGNWLNVITGATVILVVLQSPDGLVPFNIRHARALVGRVLGRIGPWPTGRARQPVGGAASSLQAPISRRRTPVTVEARDLTVRFGGQAALDGVSLAIAPGTVVGLIGPNGAGKSTLIDVLCGFQPPTHGGVAVDGRAIDRLSASQRARIGLSRSFQSLELFEDMSVLDNLRTAADLCPPTRYLRDLAWPRRVPLGATASAAIEDFRLGAMLDKRPSQLDYARRRLTAIARALASDPAVVFLDEPAAGLDAGERAELRHLLRRVADDWGIGVLVVEHDVEFVFTVCDEIVALDFGRVIARGAPSEVRDDERLVEAFLGAPTAKNHICSDTPVGSPRL